MQQGGRPQELKFTSPAPHTQGVWRPLKWKREHVLVPKIPHHPQSLEVGRLAWIGAAYQQGRDPDSLTIPLPSHSSYPLHQGGLKAPTGASFKTFQNPGGLVETGACSMPDLSLLGNGPIKGESDNTQRKRPELPVPP